MSDEAKFKAGDRVVCVDNGGIPSLTKGAVYTVRETSSTFGDIYLTDRGPKDPNGFFSFRFRMAEPHDGVQLSATPKLDAATAATVAKTTEFLKAMAPTPTGPSWESRYAAEQYRANKLSDEAGTLRTERDDLLRENAQLRRTIEKLERGVPKRSQPGGRDG